jgi:hypothetical protein
MAEAGDRPVFEEKKPHPGRTSADGDQQQAIRRHNQLTTINLDGVSGHALIGPRGGAVPHSRLPSMNSEPVSVLTSTKGLPVGKFSSGNKRLIAVDIT